MCVRNFTPDFIDLHVVWYISRAAFELSKLQVYINFWRFCVFLLSFRAKGRREGPWAENSHFALRLRVRCAWSGASRRRCWSGACALELACRCRVLLSACAVELGCWRPSRAAVELGRWCRCRGPLRDVYGSAGRWMEIMLYYVYAACCPKNHLLCGVYAGVVCIIVSTFIPCLTFSNL